MSESKINKETYRKLIIIGALYLGEGFPYGFLYTTLSYYFRTYGIELKHIGLISLIGLPWSFKAFWAPMVDRFGQRWHWIASMQTIMAIQIILIAHLDIANLPMMLWVTLLIFSFAGATQDIAIDAYTIDILEPHEQGIANGIRNTTFRIAAIISGGALVAFSGLLEKKFPSFLSNIKSLFVSYRINNLGAPGWTIPFYFLAMLIFILAVSVVLLKGFHVPKAVKLQESAKKNFYLYWYYPLKELFSRSYVIPVLFFILFFKLGDQLMSQMVPAFWYDRGFSKEEYGLISGTAGIILTIFGALVGGILTTRWDVGKALWILGGFQAISNLGYASVAYFDASRYYMYSASAFESFTAGLGTGAFLAFLMRLCKKQFSATQYALLSSLFSIGGKIAPWLGGYAAQAMGYAQFFLLTFIAALPAFALLPFVLKNLKSLPSTD